MNLFKCLLTQGSCYRYYQSHKLYRLDIKGITVHSTGAANPYIKRYVQPADDDPNKADMLSILGRNINNNDWNHGGKDRQVGVHAFIGKLQDGSIATVQCLPYDCVAWHCANNYGNGHYLSFEICEDALNDANYFNKVYQEAAEYCAFLCKTYNLDPLGKNVILCHKEMNRAGIGNDHTDVEHWFPKFGKTMDDFRALVYSLVHKDDKKQEEDDYMTREQILTELKDTYIKEYKDLPDGLKAELRELLDKKIINGGTSYAKNPDDINMYLSDLKTVIICKRMIDALRNGG